MSRFNREHPGDDRRQREALRLPLPAFLDDGDDGSDSGALIPTTIPLSDNRRLYPPNFHLSRGGVSADRARIEPLINEHTRAILMTNPGNPTGVVLSPEEVRLMAEIAREHDLFLIGDEVYREFVYGGEKLTTLLELEDMAEYVVVIDSVSSGFPPAARVGALISRNQELMANAMKICQGRLCCNAGSGGCHGTLRCGFLVFRRCAGGVQKAQGHLYGGPLQNSRCDVRMS